MASSDMCGVGLLIAYVTLNNSVTPVSRCVGACFKDLRDLANVVMNSVCR